MIETKRNPTEFMKFIYELFKKELGEECLAEKTISKEQPYQFQRGPVMVHLGNATEISPDYVFGVERIRALLYTPDDILRKDSIELIGYLEIARWGGDLACDTEKGTIHRNLEPKLRVTTTDLQTVCAFRLQDIPQNSKINFFNAKNYQVVGRPFEKVVSEVIFNCGLRKDPYNRTRTAVV